MTRNFGVQHRPRVDAGCLMWVRIAVVILMLAIVVLIVSIGAFHD